jgi:hypothetical protein
MVQVHYNMTEYFLWTQQTEFIAVLAVHGNSVEIHYVWKWFGPSGKTLNVKL